MNRKKKHLAFVQAACFSSSWFPTEQRAKLVSAACLLFLIFGQPWEPANARESKDTSQRVGFAAHYSHRLDTGCTDRSYNFNMFNQFSEVPLLIFSFLFFHPIPIFRCLPNIAKPRRWPVAGGRWPWKAPWQRQPWHLVSHSPDLS